MRKPALWVTALILLVSACVPAFASTGDRVLMHESRLADTETMWVEDVLPCGNGLYLIVNDLKERKIIRYTDIQAEPEEYVQENEKMPGEAAEGEQSSITLTETWFVRGEELYAVTNTTTYGKENPETELDVKHVRLENGKVILEESDLPDVDLSGLIMEEEDHTYTKEIRHKFTTDDKLFLHVYCDSPDELLVIDLQDGTCMSIELDGDINEMTAGPEGSVLITRSEWTDDSTVKVRINRLDPADRSETELAELDGLSFTRIAPNYSAEKDTLYYYNTGELWAMPHFDAAQAETVNDCPDNGIGTLLLPNGFVVIWTYDTVLVRNTDPALRSSVTLHVMEFADGAAVTEALYDMNNTRGDISVAEHNGDWNNKQEVLQAMLNRDSNTDIYVYKYDSTEFSALRKRNYLPDLSSGAGIAASTERLYPFLQEAVKQNGNIIGVPVSISGETLGIHMEQWKKTGGTEEELPKTWNQFFDWLESLPERLEGQDVYLAPWQDRVSFRADILEIMLDQYEVQMERKGETDYSFASPELCGLVQRLNNLDYDALKIAEPQDEEESEQEEYIDEEYDHDPLLETYTAVTLNGEPDYVPLALSFSENEEPVVPISVSIAFMNPYSEHPRETMDFLACVAENLNVYDAAAAYSDRTVPMHRPGYENDRKSIQDMMDELNKALQDEEGENRVVLEEKLSEAEEDMENNERYGWIISPTEVERYQKWQRYFRVRGYSFLNVLFEEDGAGDEEEGAYEKLFYSEESAALSPEELLGRLDQKVRMIRMESN